MSIRLLLQKQIALDDEPEQILHAVVVGFQWDALFLEVREFVESQAAADSVTGGVLQEAEGDLVDAVIRQVRLQGVQVLGIGASMTVVARTPGVTRLPLVERH